MEIKTGKRQKAKRTRKDIKLIFLFPVFTFCLLSFVQCPAFSADKWTGVDESVVEKIAGEHGRHAGKPLIDTDQGDLLLFVFLIAGALGGFAAGYYWRMLLEGKRKRE
jgi:ABC-type cobalt transport system substrate-binding protein